MKKGAMLKVLEGYRMLSLALERRITQREAAREPRLSVPHTKRLVRGLKKAGGNADCVFYQRTHPARNRPREGITDKVVTLKSENRET